MGGCQNYGPFLGTLNIRCRIIIGTQKGTIILTTTHVYSNSTVLLSSAARRSTTQVMNNLDFVHLDAYTEAIVPKAQPLDTAGMRSRNLWILHAYDQAVVFWASKP